MKIETGTRLRAPPCVNKAKNKKSIANNRFVLLFFLLEVRKCKLNSIKRNTVKFDKPAMANVMFSHEAKLNKSTVTGMKRYNGFPRRLNLLKYKIAIPTNDKLPISERKLKFIV